MPNPLGKGQSNGKHQRKQKEWKSSFLCFHSVPYTSIFSAVCRQKPLQRVNPDTFSGIGVFAFYSSFRN